MGTHNIDLKIKTTGAKQATAQLNSLNKAMGTTAKGVTAINSTTKAIHGNTRAIQSNVGSLNLMAKGFIAYQVAKEAVEGLTNVVVDSSKAFFQQERQFVKLNTIMKQAPGWLEGADKQIIKLTESLQKLGIVGDEVMQSGLAQLASFQIAPDSLNILAPGLANLTAWKYGTNANVDNTSALADMLGKVMSGQFGALTRAGIVFDDKQKALLQGYYKEKDQLGMATTLRKILDDNTGNINATLRASNEGTVKAFTNAMGDLKEEFGGGIWDSPEMKETLKQLTNTLSSPEFQAIIKGTGAATGAGLIGVANYMGLVPYSAETDYTKALKDKNTSPEKLAILKQAANEAEMQRLNEHPVLKYIMAQGYDYSLKSNKNREKELKKELDNVKLSDKLRKEKRKELSDVQDLIKKTKELNEQAGGFLSFIGESAKEHPFLTTGVGLYGAHKLTQLTKWLYGAGKNIYKGGKKGVNAIANSIDFNDAAEAANIAGRWDPGLTTSWKYDEAWANLLGSAGTKNGKIHFPEQKLNAFTKIDRQFMGMRNTVLHEVTGLDVDEIISAYKNGNLTGGMLAKAKKVAQAQRAHDIVGQKNAIELAKGYKIDKKYGAFSKNFDESINILGKPIGKITKLLRFLSRLGDALMVIDYGQATARDTYKGGKALLNKVTAAATGGLSDSNIKDIETKYNDKKISEAYFTQKYAKEADEYKTFIVQSLGKLPQGSLKGYIEKEASLRAKQEAINKMFRDKTEDSAIAEKETLTEKLPKWYDYLTKKSALWRTFTWHDAGQSISDFSANTIGKILFPNGVTNSTLPWRTQLSKTGKYGLNSVPNYVVADFKKANVPRDKLDIKPITSATEDLKSQFQDIISQIGGLITISEDIKADVISNSAAITQLENNPNR